MNEENIQGNKTLLCLKHAEDSDLGLAEKLLEGRLHGQEWLTDLDLECLLAATGLQGKVTIAPFDAENIGLVLHFAREAHKGDEPRLPYKIPMILNKGQCGNVKSRGSHWVYAIVTVDPGVEPVNLTVEYQDSLRVSTDEQARLQGIFTRALKFEPTSQENAEDIIARNVGTIEQEDDAYCIRYKAFPETIVDPINDIQIIGDGAQSDSWTCGYRAFHRLIQQAFVAEDIDEAQREAFNKVFALEHPPEVAALRDLLYELSLGSVEIPQGILARFAKVDPEAFEVCEAEAPRKFKADYLSHCLAYVKTLTPENRGERQFSYKALRLNSKLAAEVEKQKAFVENNLLKQSNETVTVFKRPKDDCYLNKHVVDLTVDNAIIQTLDFSRFFSEINEKDDEAIEIIKMARIQVLASMLVERKVAKLVILNTNDVSSNDIEELKVALENCLNLIEVVIEPQLVTGNLTTKSKIPREYKKLVNSMSGQRILNIKELTEDLDVETQQNEINDRMRFIVDVLNEEKFTTLCIGEVNYSLGNIDDFIAMLQSCRYLSEIVIVSEETDGDLVDKTSIQKNRLEEYKKELENKKKELTEAIVKKELDAAMLFTDLEGNNDSLKHMKVARGQLVTNTLVLSEEKIEQITIKNLENISLDDVYVLFDALSDYPNLKKINIVSQPKELLQCWKSWRQKKQIQHAFAPLIARNRFFLAAEMSFLPGEDPWLQFWFRRFTDSTLFPEDMAITKRLLPVLPRYPSRVESVYSPYIRAMSKMYFRSLFNFLETYSDYFKSNQGTFPFEVFNLGDELYGSGISLNGLTVLNEHLKGGGYFPFLKIKLWFTTPFDDEYFNILEETINLLAKDYHHIDSIELQIQNEYPRGPNYGRDLTVDQYKRLIGLFDLNLSFCSTFKVLGINNLKYEIANPLTQAKLDLDNRVWRNRRKKNLEQRRAKISERKEVKDEIEAVVVPSKLKGGHQLRACKKKVFDAASLVGVEVTFELAREQEVQQEVQQEVDPKIGVSKVSETELDAEAIASLDDTKLIDFESYINTKEVANNGVLIQVAISASQSTHGGKFGELVFNNAGSDKYLRMLWGNITGGGKDKQHEIWLPNSIRYLTLEAATTIDSLPQHFLAGFNIDNLPPGFFVKQYNDEKNHGKDGLVLCYDISRYTENKNTSPLTLCLKQMRRRIPWSGDLRQFSIYWKMPEILKVTLPDNTEKKLPLIIAAGEPSLWGFILDYYSNSGWRIHNFNSYTREKLTNEELITKLHNHLKNTDLEVSKIVWSLLVSDNMDLFDWIQLIFQINSSEEEHELKPVYDFLKNFLEEIHPNFFKYIWKKLLYNFCGLINGFDENGDNPRAATYIKLKKFIFGMVGDKLGKQFFEKYSWYFSREEKIEAYSVDTNYNKKNKFKINEEIFILFELLFNEGIEGLSDLLDALRVLYDSDKELYISVKGLFITRNRHLAANLASSQNLEVIRKLSKLGPIQKQWWMVLTKNEVDWVNAGDLVESYKAFTYFFDQLESTGIALPWFPEELLTDLPNMKIILDRLLAILGNVPATHLEEQLGCLNGLDLRVDGAWYAKRWDHFHFFHPKMNLTATSLFDMPDKQLYKVKYDSLKDKHKHSIKEGLKVIFEQCENGDWLIHFRGKDGQYHIEKIINEAHISVLNELEYLDYTTIVSINHQENLKEIAKSFDSGICAKFFNEKYLGKDTLSYTVNYHHLVHLTQFNWGELDLTTHFTHASIAFHRFLGGVDNLASPYATYVNLIDSLEKLVYFSVTEETHHSVSLTTKMYLLPVLAMVTTGDRGSKNFNGRLSKEFLNFISDVCANDCEEYLQAVLKTIAKNMQVLVDKPNVQEVTALIKLLLNYKYSANTESEGDCKAITYESKVEEVFKYFKESGMSSFKVWHALDMWQCNQNSLSATDYISCTNQLQGKSEFKGNLDDLLKIVALLKPPYDKNDFERLIDRLVELREKKQFPHVIAILSTVDISRIENHNSFPTISDLILTLKDIEHIDPEILPAHFNSKLSIYESVRIEGSDEPSPVTLSPKLLLGVKNLNGLLEDFVELDESNRDQLIWDANRLQSPGAAKYIQEHYCYLVDEKVTLEIERELDKIPSAAKAVIKVAALDLNNIKSLAIRLVQEKMLTWLENTFLATVYFEIDRSLEFQGEVNKLDFLNKERKDLECLYNFHREIKSQLGDNLSEDSSMEEIFIFIRNIAYSMEQYLNPMEKPFSSIGEVLSSIREPLNSIEKKLSSTSIKESLSFFEKIKILNEMSSFLKEPLKLLNKALKDIQDYLDECNNTRNKLAVLRDKSFLAHLDKKFPRPVIDLKDKENIGGKSIELLRYGQYAGSLFKILVHCYKMWQNEFDIEILTNSDNVGESDRKLSMSQIQKIFEAIAKLPLVHQPTELLRAIFPSETYAVNLDLNLLFLRFIRVLNLRGLDIGQKKSLILAVRDPNKERYINNVLEVLENRGQGSDTVIALYLEAFSKDIDLLLLQEIDEVFSTLAKKHMPILKSVFYCIAAHDDEKIANKSFLYFIKLIKNLPSNDLQYQENFLRIIFLSSLTDGCYNSKNYKAIFFEDGIAMKLAALFPNKVDDFSQIVELFKSRPYPNLIRLQGLLIEGINLEEEIKSFEFDPFAVRVITKEAILTSLYNKDIVFDELDEEVIYLEKQVLEKEKLDSLYDMSTAHERISEIVDLDSGRPLPYQVQCNMYEQIAYITAVGRGPTSLLVPCMSVEEKKALWALYDPAEAKPASYLSQAQIQVLIKHYRQIISGRLQPVNARQMELARLEFAAIIREVMLRGTSLFPYSTQMISMLNIMHQGGSIFSEIRTGEGKGLITAMLAAFKWMESGAVDVCSANMTLAKRDKKEFSSFFDYLGIPCTLIRADSDVSFYQQDGVNYSDIAEMALFQEQRDLYHDPMPEKVSLILDEADFAVLDSTVQFRFATTLDSDFDPNNNVNAWVYPFILEFVRRECSEGSYILDNDDCNKNQDIMNLKNFIANYPGKLPLNALLKGQFAVKYSDEQLDRWIDSAVIARDLKENEHFVVRQLNKEESNAVGYDECIYAARVMINHRESSGSKFSEGVHQFLHARLNMEKKNKRFHIEPEKSYLASRSSKSFCDHYLSHHDMNRKLRGDILGLTGTTGSETEMQEMRETYGFKFFCIPPHEPLRREPEKIILARRFVKQVGWFWRRRTEYTETAEQAHFKNILENALQAIALKQPVLIFCKDIASSKAVFKMLQRELPSSADEGMASKAHLQLCNAEQNEEEIEKVIGKSATSPMITITTPILGRGTDIKIKKSVENGMHVLCTSIAAWREYRQNIGRTARNGAKGSSALVISEEEFTIRDMSVPSADTEVSLRIERIRLQIEGEGSRQRAERQGFADIKEQFSQQFNILSRQVKTGVNDNFTRLRMSYKPVWNKIQIELFKIWDKFLREIDNQWKEIILELETTLYEEFIRYQVDNPTVIKADFMRERHHDFLMEKLNKLLKEANQEWQKTHKACETTAKALSNEALLLARKRFIAARKLEYQEEQKEEKEAREKVIKINDERKNIEQEAKRKKLQPKKPIIKFQAIKNKGSLKTVKNFFSKKRAEKKSAQEECRSITEAIHKAFLNKVPIVIVVNSCNELDELSTALKKIISEGEHAHFSSYISNEENLGIEQFFTIGNISFIAPTFSLSRLPELSEDMPKLAVFGFGADSNNDKYWQMFRTLSCYATDKPEIWPAYDKKQAIENQMELVYRKEFKVGKLVLAQEEKITLPELLADLSDDEFHAPPDTEMKLPNAEDATVTTSVRSIAKKARVTPEALRILKPSETAADIAMLRLMEPGDDAREVVEIRSNILTKELRSIAEKFAEASVVAFGRQVINIPEKIMINDRATLIKTILKIALDLKLKKCLDISSVRSVRKNTLYTMVQEVMQLVTKYGSSSDRQAAAEAFEEHIERNRYYLKVKPKIFVKYMKEIGHDIYYWQDRGAFAKITELKDDARSIDILLDSDFTKSYFKFEVLYPEKIGQSPWDALSNFVSQQISEYRSHHSKTRNRQIEQLEEDYRALATGNSCDLPEAEKTKILISKLDELSLTVAEDDFKHDREATGLFDRFRNSFKGNRFQFMLDRSRDRAFTCLSAYNEDFNFNEHADYLMSLVENIWARVCWHQLGSVVDRMGTDHTLIELVEGLKVLKNNKDIDVYEKYNQLLLINKSLLLHIKRIKLQDDSMKVFGKSNVEVFLDFNRDVSNRIFRFGEALNLSSQRLPKLDGSTQLKHIQRDDLQREMTNLCQSFEASNLADKEEYKYIDKFLIPTNIPEKNRSGEYPKDNTEKFIHHVLFLIEQECKDSFPNTENFYFNEVAYNHTTKYLTAKANFVDDTGQSYSYSVAINFLTPGASLVKCDLPIIKRMDFEADMQAAEERLVKQPINDNYLIAQKVKIVKFKVDGLKNDLPDEAKSNTQSLINFILYEVQRYWQLHFPEHQQFLFNYIRYDHTSDSLQIEISIFDAEDNESIYSFEFKNLINKSPSQFTYKKLIAAEVKLDYALQLALSRLQDSLSGLKNSVITRGVSLDNPFKEWVDNIIVTLPKRSGLDEQTELLLYNTLYEIKRCYKAYSDLKEGEELELIALIYDLETSKLIIKANYKAIDNKSYTVTIEIENLSLGSETIKLAQRIVEEKTLELSIKRSNSENTESGYATNDSDPEALEAKFGNYSSQNSSSFWVSQSKGKPSPSDEEDCKKSIVKMPTISQC